MRGLGSGVPAAGRGEYEGRALIELGYRPWGYAWLFPKESLLSVGIVVPREQGNRMKGQVAAYARRLGLNEGDAAIRKGHKIRFRRGEEAIADDRTLLAGDAAGLADEFTEEGISYAVHSGRLAAQHVLRGLDGGSVRGYQAAIDREVMPELRAARLIGYMFYGMLNRAPRPWMVATRAVPYVWDAFFAVQRGESTYAREAARIPVLPRLAARMVDRQ
ncbi:MAG: hypothetical protein U5Q44_01960 [Dehalococcoidia bacterium]|nr:hypothetical protein [Dehalococcoidia bacterium]